MGGFFFKFGAVSDHVGAVAACQRERGRRDGVDAMPHHRDAPHRSTAEDLAKAEPAVEAAMAALDSLDPKSLTECKGMIKPPGGVDDIFASTMILLAGIYPAVQHKKLKVKDRSWDAAKKQCLGNIKEYIEYLKEIKVKVRDSVLKLTLNLMSSP